MSDPTGAGGKRLSDFVAEALCHVKEITPEALSRRFSAGRTPLLLDVREASEFAVARLPGTINVPRGLLETAADWGFDSTVPALAGARSRAIVVICDVGDRSALAARTLQQLGFTDVAFLRRGVRGWRESGLRLVDGAGGPIEGATAGT